MRVNRRQFIQSGIAGIGLVSASPVLGLVKTGDRLWLEAENLIPLAAPWTSSVEPGGTGSDLASPTANGAQEDESGGEYLYGNRTSGEFEAAISAPFSKPAAVWVRIYYTSDPRWLQVTVNGTKSPILGKLGAPNQPDMPGWHWIKLGDIQSPVLRLSMVGLGDPPWDAWVDIFLVTTDLYYTPPDTIPAGGYYPAPPPLPTPKHPLPIITGNQSVVYIQHSPIGAFPSSAGEPIPAEAGFHREHLQGVKADEDYEAWGAIEKTPGVWDWKHYDQMVSTQRAAGLEYDSYLWLHCPPVWLREGKFNLLDAPDHCTLFRCMEHDLPTNTLSIFDPATVQWFERYYRHQAAHLGDRLGRTYVALVGPYGEGNYPLPFAEDWLNEGHCHQGWWCNDPYAHRTFQSAMKQKYTNLTALNRAWNAQFQRWDALNFPDELKLGPAKMKPAEERTYIPERRRWLDFMAWYLQAIPDFSEKVYLAARKYWRADQLKMKPGGSSGGVNPLYFGTYCPAYAKAVGKYHLRMQPADLAGHIFGDNWISTAYRFYGAPLSSEPPGALSRADFLRRMFSDGCGGASELFTYEWSQHARDARRWIHLYRGIPSRKDAAVFAPSTWYMMNGSLQPSIDATTALRDLVDVDVLDELPISDGALRRHRVLIAFQMPVVERDILVKILEWVKGGGILVARAPVFPTDVESKTELTRRLFPRPFREDSSTSVAHVGSGLTVRYAYGNRDHETGFLQLVERAVYEPSAWIPGRRGAERVDDGLDGVWTAVFPDRLVFYNYNRQPVTAFYRWQGQRRTIHVEAWDMAEVIT